MCGSGWGPWEDPLPHATRTPLSRAVPHRLFLDEAKSRVIKQHDQKLLNRRSQIGNNFQLAKTLEKIKK